MVDGQFGFGQVMGEQATKLGIAKAGRQGVAVVALRNSGHLGRIGDWAEMAAHAGKVSLHFVNTSGGGILVAPFGGSRAPAFGQPDRRGRPGQERAADHPRHLDLHDRRGQDQGRLQQGGEGPRRLHPGRRRAIRPTTPRRFTPRLPARSFPLGGHKGYGLSVIAEVLAGALTGGSCSHFGVDRVANNMLSIIFDPTFFQSADGFSEEIDGFITHVKSSRTVMPDGEILMPGEPEARTRARKLREGIEIDDTTWGQIVATAESLGVSVESTAP